MKLHDQYIENMKILLGEGFDAFMASYGDDRISGLRVNTLKISVEAFLKIAPFELIPIPWTTDGFYVDTQERPGKHPFWHAGLYYIQEPSAMLPASLLDLAPGQSALDLCASPGGKTLQMAAKLQGRGVLVTNDISTGRIKPLVRNIEQYGVTNAIVVNDRHDRLSGTLGNFFDRVLVDAPCSGEGMFRKDEGLIRDWTPASNDQFSETQKEILAHAASMLKPGGQLIYSTCTFSPKENEQVLNSLLQVEEENLAVYKMAELGELAGGIVTTGGFARVWPHLSRGEGHFAAKVEKCGSQEMEVVHVQRISPCATYQTKTQITFVEGTDQEGQSGKVGKRSKSKGQALANKAGSKNASEGQRVVSFTEAPEPLRAFIEENMASDGPMYDKLVAGNMEVFMDRINLLPEVPVDLQGIRIVRKGLQIGELTKGRFTPSQAFIMAMQASDFKRRLDLALEDEQVIKYLKGDTLMIEGLEEKGFYMITVEGYPLGLGKWDGKMMKNLYPPAWRML